MNRLQQYANQVSILQSQASKDRKEIERLQNVIIEIRHSLQMANDTPNGPISDTIWMMHESETLFDWIDSKIEGFSK